MRRHPDSSGNLSLEEGDYGKNSTGIWFVRPPGQHTTLIGMNHKVTVHKDKTITVVPTLHIKGMSPSDGNWHGHLIKGEFIEVKG